jgi:hypothetical protein
MDLILGYGVVIAFAVLCAAFVIWIVVMAVGGVHDLRRLRRRRRDRIDDPD